MKKNLVPFAFEQTTIRSITDETGAVLFVGKDVAEALGYVDTVSALKDHCRGVAKRHPIIDSLGRTQEARVISSGDVLRLITHSKLPAAERFESWIFDEVIPSVIKYGHYQMQGHSLTYNDHTKTGAGLLAVELVSKDKVLDAVALLNVHYQQVMEMETIYSYTEDFAVAPPKNLFPTTHFLDNPMAGIRNDVLVLRCLRNQPGQTFPELKANTRLPKATLDESLDRLEKNGFVCYKSVGRGRLKYHSL